jgi:malate dehydrogenase
MKQVKVVVTGATGQVAYALLPRIAAGEMFGPDTEVDLRLSDIPQMIDKAKGVVMELEDGAYPLLSRVSASADRAESHADADWVLLVGSVPRGPGMERGDLIRKNGPIFVDEGKAIAERAAITAAPRCCTAGMKALSSQVRSTASAAGLPLTLAFVKSGYSVALWFPQITSFFTSFTRAPAFAARSERARF